MKALLLLAGLLFLTASPCLGYRILLDMDQDGDPYTFNTLSTRDTVKVSLILAPDGAGEWITYIEFGLGGSCHDGMDCGWSYGVGTELYDGFAAWLNHPLFGFSMAGGLLCSECCGNPGFHYMFEAEAEGAGFQLQENIYLMEFLAWAYLDDDPMCPRPETDLMTFPAFGPLEPWCELLIAQEGTSLSEIVPRPATWREIKSLY